MKARKSLSILLSAVALLALSVPAFAQMKDMPMKHDGAGHRAMMDMGNMDQMGGMMGNCLEHADKMGLSEDQTMKLKPLHREMQKKQARFVADLKIAEIELAEIMEVKDFDLEKASLAVKKIAEVKTSHHLEILRAMKEMRTTVTDEQFKHMKKMMAMKMDKMDGKRPGHKMDHKHK